MARVQPTSAARAERKQRGDYPTPAFLVDLVVEHTLPAVRPGDHICILDPACGDGRFLVAAGRRATADGATVELVGIELDASTARAARTALGAAGFPDAVVEVGDALERSWDREFDVVVGNPPYLSQLATTTTRGGASALGGGPYADACAEFLALAIRLVRRGGGRVGLVLPQSILASRDAGPVRRAVSEEATSTWTWWSRERVFDAQVRVCALAFERRDAPVDAGDDVSWGHVVADALGVPPLPALGTAGVLGERTRLTANFRDQYYGLVPAVADGADGPPLVTSGLIDPGRCAWGTRDVTFARRRMRRPAVELTLLSPAMRRWAEAMLVPKVLVANQSRVVEAVADPDGRWLAGVPVLAARPADPAVAPLVAAVLTSPVATAWAWHRAAGTGLSAETVRLGPRWLAELPWPAGDLDEAAAALADGDVEGCGRAVQAAYGLERGGSLAAWWACRLPRTEAPS